MLELIIRGGWALWIITFCSIMAMAVTFERWRTLRRANIDSEDLLNQVAGALESGNVEKAIAICNEWPGPIAETMKIGLRKLVFLDRIGKKPEEIEEGVVAAMEEHGGFVVEFLERNLTTLATVASLAPILGMMGTVVGMIRAFGSVAKAHNLSPDVVAGGIAEALLCTAGGLVVAALATVEYNYFTTRVNRFVLRVQATATQLVERLLDVQLSRMGRPTPAAVSAGSMSDSSIATLPRMAKPADLNKLGEASKLPEAAKPDRVPAHAAPKVVPPPAPRPPAARAPAAPPVTPPPTAVKRPTS